MLAILYKNLTFINNDSRPAFTTNPLIFTASYIVKGDEKKSTKLFSSTNEEELTRHRYQTARTYSFFHS